MRFFVCWPPRTRGGALWAGSVAVALLLISTQILFAADGRDRLVEGAKKEGKLVIYASVSITDLTIMVKKFKEKYPFIQVEYSRAGGERLVTKILNEARAKTYIPDVIQTGTFELHLFKKQQLIAPYTSPERTAYGEQFKDGPGYYTTFFFTTKPILYNTKLVPKNRIPKSYEDLLDPYWKGKLAFEGMGGGASGIRWFICVMKRMGDKAGEAFMRRLAGQDLITRSGTSLIGMLVAAGEFPVAIVSSGHLAESLKDTGAPVEWVRNDPMYTTHTGISLSSHASSPNSAKLYVDFILSKEGQEIMRGLHRIPARSDVEPDPPQLLQGVNLFPYNPEWSEDYERYEKIYRDIFS